MISCTLKIKEYKDYFKKSERNAAEYILEHLEEIIGLSIAELSQKSGASQAAIMRMCKTVGFSGYREFMIALAGELAAQKPEEQADYADISPGDTIESLIKNISANSKKAIDDSNLIIDTEHISQAVSALWKAETIALYGIGASAVVALDAQQKFMRINKQCYFFGDSYRQMTSTVNLKENDAAILISWSGETKEVVNIAQILKELPITTICITKYGNNSLAQLCDFKLQLLSPEFSMRIGAMSSRIAQLNMIDILYSTLVSQNYAQVKQHLKKTHMFGKLKELS